MNARNSTYYAPSHKFDLDTPLDLETLICPKLEVPITHYSKHPFILSSLQRDTVHQLQSALSPNSDDDIAESFRHKPSFTISEVVLQINQHHVALWLR